VKKNLRSLATAFAQHHVPLGNLKLGYLCFEVADVPPWQRLLQGVIGMVPADDDALVFTHDHYQHRVSLSHGASDDITAAGWEAGDDATFDAIVERLEQGGVRLREGSGDQQGPGASSGWSASRIPTGIRSSFSAARDVVRARFNRPWCRAAFLPATPAWATCC
jgi:hypothetical protein